MSAQDSPKSYISADSIDSIRLTAPLYSGDLILNKTLQKQHAIATAPAKSAKPKVRPIVAAPKQEIIVEKEIIPSVCRPKTPNRNFTLKKAYLVLANKRNIIRRGHKSYLNQFRTAFKLPGSDQQTIVRTESVETIYGGSTPSSHSSLNEYIENQAAQTFPQIYPKELETAPCIVQQNQYLHDKQLEEEIFNEIRKQNLNAICSGGEPMGTNKTTLSDVIKEERLNIPYSMNGTLSLTGHKSEIKKHEPDHKKAIFRMRTASNREPLKKEVNQQDKKLKHNLKEQRDECCVGVDENRITENCLFKSNPALDNNNINNNNNIDMKITNNIPAMGFLGADREKIKDKLNLLRKRSDYGKRIEFRNQKIIKFSKSLNQTGIDDEQICCFDDNNNNNNNNNNQKQEKKVKEIYKREGKSLLNTFEMGNLNKYDDESDGTLTKTLSKSALMTTSSETLKIYNTDNDNTIPVKQQNRAAKKCDGYYNMLMLKQQSNEKLVKKMSNQSDRIKPRKIKSLTNNKNIGDGDCKNISKPVVVKTEKPSLETAVEETTTTNDNDLKNKKIKSHSKLLINCNMKNNNNNRINCEAIDVIRTDLELLKLQHMNDMRVAEDIRKLIITKAESQSMEKKKNL